MKYRGGLIKKKKREIIKKLDSYLSSLNETLLSEQLELKSRAWRHMKVQTNTFKKRTVSLISINYKTEVLLFFESHSILHEKKDEWWFDYLSKKKIYLPLSPSVTMNIHEFFFVFSCGKISPCIALALGGLLYSRSTGPHILCFLVTWEHILVFFLFYGNISLFVWFLWEHILIFLVVLHGFYRNISLFFWLLK